VGTEVSFIVCPILSPKAVDNDFQCPFFRLNLLAPREADEESDAIISIAINQILLTNRTPEPHFCTKSFAYISLRSAVAMRIETACFAECGDEL
jgi:hypothetical protein